MSKDYVIPKKLQMYIKRLVGEYKNNGNAKLSEVLEQSKFEVKIETAYDNWDGGQDGHDVIFFVPEILFHAIPLDSQQDIQNKVSQDLNKAASAASKEYINAVHFEYSEESSKVVDQKSQSRIWKSNGIKLFISHRDTQKVHAHKLATELEFYGVTSFVAHDSIEPDEDWQNEIEGALQTMDVMLAFISDDFFASAWTNQEIGFALARQIPIISLKVASADPIGFIRNRQAIKRPIVQLRLAANDIWQALEKRLAGTLAFRNAIIRRFIQSPSFEVSKQSFQNLKNISNLTVDEVDQIIKAYNTNSQLNGCYALNGGNQLTNFLNKFSQTNLVVMDGMIRPKVRNFDDDIPF